MEEVDGHLCQGSGWPDCSLEPWALADIPVLVWLSARISQNRRRCWMILGLFADTQISPLRVGAAEPFSLKWPPLVPPWCANLGVDPGLARQLPRANLNSNSLTDQNWRRAFERGELSESSVALIPVTVPEPEGREARTRSSCAGYGRFDPYRATWASVDQRGTRS
jgi:hypothetical protein